MEAPVYLVLFLIITGSKLSECTNDTVDFHIINNCDQTIWPAAVPGDSFSGAGFTLMPGRDMIFTIPESWSGKFWARTGCDIDRDGNISCQTGGCGSSFKCSDSGAPPASLAEIALSDNSADRYSVRIDEGFNLPVTVTPLNGGGDCGTAGCDADPLPLCPPKQAVRDGGGRVVGCRSACDVFGTDAYCCRGKYENSTDCDTTPYLKRLRKACPMALAYPGPDYDPDGMFTCSAPEMYVVSFCSYRKHPSYAYHNGKLVRDGASESRAIRKWRMMLLTFILCCLLKT